MEMLGKYELTGHLSSQNSGYSVWGFGKKDGKDFFIKQFLSPKFPENDTVSSLARLQKKKQQCERFERQKVSIYQALNENTDGNAVRVCEFFRIESKYYITMPKIEALPWSVQDVAALPEQEKRRLCAIIVHGIVGLHRGHIVHADLKHDNVLFMRTKSGAVTAKIIDFDSSFLETEPPTPGEDIIGDLVYFSPEACASIWGTETDLSCKMDIFSLGVLFHQYFTGELPWFDTEQCNYAGEAVAKGLSLTVSETIPEDVAELLKQMLLPDPADRPDAEAVFRILSATAGQMGDPPEQESKDCTNGALGVVVEGTNEKSPFYTPGDLDADSVQKESAVGACAGSVADHQPNG